MFFVMAEVHVIGEISTAKGFKKQTLFCKCSLQYGNNWKLISGKREIQTHVTSFEFEDTLKWSFPLDFHLATSGVQGWPKFCIQIYHLDWLGRSHLLAYGFVNVPTTPGNHQIECYTWRPLDNLRERFIQHFLGGGPQLKTPDLIFTLKDRYKLNTESMGIVCLKVNVILRHFVKFGVEYK